MTTDKPKPREWWIKFYEYDDDLNKDAKVSDTPQGGFEFHVVEHSALEAAEREVAELRDILESQTASFDGADARSYLFYAQAHEIIKARDGEIERLKGVREGKPSALWLEHWVERDKLTAAIALIEQLETALEKLRSLIDDDFVKSETADGETEYWVSDLQVQDITEQAFALASAFKRKTKGE